MAHHWKDAAVVGDEREFRSNRSKRKRKEGEERREKAHHYPSLDHHFPAVIIDNVVVTR